MDTNTSQPRVLIVDLSETETLLVVDTLREEWPLIDLVKVDNESALRKSLGDQHWDMIICDLNTPGFGGPSALEILSERGGDLPLIIASDHITTEAATKLLKAGADRHIALAHRNRDQHEATRERDAVQHSKRIFRTLVDTLPNLIWLKDADGNYLACNRRFELFFGARESEILGKTDYDFVDRELADLFRKNDRLAMARGGPSTNEEEVTYASDGHKEYLETTKVPMHDDEGNLIGVLGIAHDITEQKQLEAELKEHRYRLEDMVIRRTEQLANAREQAELANEALRERDSLLRQAASISNLGYAHWNKEKRKFDDVSEVFAEIFGYTVEEFLEHYRTLEQVTKLVHPDDLEKVENFLKPVNEQSARCEYRILHREGKTRYVREIIGDSRRNNGTVTQLNITLQDITDTKLAEFDLIEAKEAAEVAARSKSAFLANMSHEIRTPMNAILGLTHLLTHSNPTTEQTERLTKIETAADHLLSIINDILDLSKIEAGKFALEESDFQLETIFDRIISLLKSQISGTELSIETEFDDVPNGLRGDATRLRQALLNYASNAAKFSEKGKIILRARKIEEKNGELLIRFEVQDTGIGIKPEKLVGIFDAFEQADTSTTRKYGGTGLGLAINRRLVELMGGEVGVESTYGEGSTFWFTARLNRGEVTDAGRDSTSGEQAKDILWTRYEGSKLLLVEDNAVNREVAKLLLKKVNLDVDVAENGLEAVNMVRSGSYDLILMDIQMPEMDGLEATQLIRSMPEHKNLPILAMTANIYEADRRACMEAGMNDFVAKPVEPGKLFAAIIDWLPERT